jgi:nucleotide-binding universal stress UspA family protein
MSGSVIVLYEQSRHGREALAEADQLARDRDARLRVVVCAPRERQDVGCAQCRANVAFWNHELDEIAHQELDEARALLDDPADTEYRVVNGSLVRALADLATRERADVIVVPWRRTGSLSRRLGRELTPRLRAAGVPEVRMAARGATVVSSAAGRSLS